MLKVYKILFLIAIAVTTTTIASAQLVKDSVPSVANNNDSIPNSSFCECGTGKRFKFENA